MTLPTKAQAAVLKRLNEGDGLYVGRSGYGLFRDSLPGHPLVRAATFAVLRRRSWIGRRKPYRDILWQWSLTPAGRKALEAWEAKDAQ